MLISFCCDMFGRIFLDPTETNQVKAAITNTLVDIHEFVVSQVQTR